MKTKKNIVLIIGRSNNMTYQTTVSDLFAFPDSNLGWIILYDYKSLRKRLPRNDVSITYV